MPDCRRVVRPAYCVKDPELAVRLAKQLGRSSEKRSGDYGFSSIVRDSKAASAPDRIANILESTCALGASVIVIESVTCKQKARAFAQNAG